MEVLLAINVATFVVLLWRHMQVSRHGAFLEDIEAHWKRKMTRGVHMDPHVLRSMHNHLERRNRRRFGFNRKANR